jgi:nitrite reductase/ring-hydroxylating ferredoxin subunit
MAGLWVADMDDRVILARLGALAARLGLPLILVDDHDAIGDDEAPVAIVIALETPDAVEWVSAYRLRWPTTLLAGSIRVPDQERWHGALAAGADLVANRGAFVAQLERALEARSSGFVQGATVARLEVRLMERDGDGLVGRLPDAPGGSIVVLRVGDRLHAIRDECPHAGASLVDGTLEGSTITCPRHGSQFDVTTGARERGPSDFPIRTYRVVSDADAIFVEVPV